MCDPELVQPLHPVEQLQKCVAYQLVVPHILPMPSAHGQTAENTHSLALGDHGEEIAFLSIVHDDVQELVLLYQSMHGDDARVGGSETVQRDLPSLEVSLSGIEPVPAEGFDGSVLGLAVPRVDGEVDDAIGAGTDDRDQLDVAVVDEAG